MEKQEPLGARPTAAPPVGSRSARGGAVSSSRHPVAAGPAAPPDPTDSETLLVTPRFRVVRRHYQTPDGQPHQREVILHPGAVVILPCLDAHRIVLVKNVRPAVGLTLIELPAGTLEPGEDPFHTAQRELAEETGYRAGTWHACLQFYMSPGILHERMHLFLAQDLSLGETHLDRGEQVEPWIVTWDEALTMVASGEIQDAKTILGLYHGDRLRHGTCP